MAGFVGALRAEKVTPRIAIDGHVRVSAKSRCRVVHRRAGRRWADLKTTKEVEAKIKAGKPGRWAVGEGDYIQVAKLNKRVTASWLFRYSGRHMGLGPYSLLSLAEA